MEMSHKEYYYIDNGTYLNLMIKNLFEGDISNNMKIYWKEMLFRIHFIATSSILRNAEWIKGILFGLEENNTMIFSSSLRGLLEAVTDSFYSLESVPTGLALNYKKIMQALEGNMNRTFHAETLEKTLIHYEFASREGKDEDKALSANAYIKEYDECSKVDTKKLYIQLCGIVHPAAGSLTSFRKEVKVSEHISYTSTCFDKNIVIKNIWKENEEAIKLLVKMSILLPVLCLKVLNSFEFEEIDSRYIEKCKVVGIFDKDKLKEIDKMME